MANLTNISLGGIALLPNFKGDSDTLKYKRIAIFVAGYNIHKHTHFTNKIFANGEELASLYFTERFVSTDRDAFIINLDEILRNINVFLLYPNFNSTLFKKRQRIYGQMYVGKDFTPHKTVKASRQ